MMIRHRCPHLALFAALCTPALLMTGCTQEVELSELPRAFSEAYCERLIECGEFDDVGLCERYLGLEREIELWWLSSDLRQALANGSASYDGEMAYECAEAIRASECVYEGFEDALFSGACEEIFAGTLANGELCQTDVQCISLSCDIDHIACDAACCAGTCTPIPSATLGQPCPAGYCVDGSICGDRSVCEAKGGVYAACYDDYECAEGLVCLGGSCGLPQTRGGACVDGECGLLGLACDTTINTCVQVQYEGAVCNPELDLCGGGLECDAATNLCRPPPGIGGECEYDEDCGDAALYCDQQDYDLTGTCRQLKANGTSCLSGWECQSWYCDNSSICRDEPSCVL